MPVTTLRAASMAAFLASAVAQQFVMYTPGGDDTAVERIDPIMSPGTIASHVHQLFGSNGLAPEMSYEGLLASDCTTVGAADGSANAADHSVYWVPSLYMEAKNGSGWLRVPTDGHKLYYKDAGSKNDIKADPFEFPKGFRMVAGDYLMRGAASNVHRQNITQWVCHSSSKPNQGTAGGFPTGVDNCDAYPGFNGAIHFPHCWNGEAFNQATPTAHVSYPDGDIQNGECPSSHPTRLPHIFMENQFNLNSIVDQVKPNSFTLAQGDNTGYGWHADFFNGWESGAIPSLFESCPQGAYGNEDIGTCPTMKKGGATKSCSLKTTYQENVDDPGQALPGCNPISDLNPALKFVIAALGVSTDKCDQLNGGSSSSTPDYSPGANSSSATTAAASSYAASSSAPVDSSPSTLASSVVVSTLASSATESSGSASSVAAGNAGESYSASSAIVAAPTTLSTYALKKHHSKSVSSSSESQATASQAADVTAAPECGATAVVTDVVYATEYVTVEARHLHARAHAHGRRRF